MPLYDSIQVFNTYSHQYHQQISMDLWNQTADAQNAALHCPLVDFVKKVHYKYAHVHWRNRVATVHLSNKS